MSEDPEKALRVVGPHVIYASNMYARWAQSRADKANGTFRELASLDEVAADPDVWIITPAERLARLGEFGADDEPRFHPLFGGLDPEESWRSLRLFEEQVLPSLIASGAYKLP